MNIEFHYYLTKILAIRAGFEEDEAEVIAYASQYVDDNNLQFEIKDPEGEIYNNYISQSFDITNPKEELARVHLLFHYIPGDPISQSVRRKDGKMHILMTTAGNRNAENVLFEAIKDEDLYLLGIASHAYTDSFSHQNFIGIKDEINSFKTKNGVLVPNIGHADAAYKPDIPNLVWKDNRLIKDNQKVDNSQRVIHAAKNLYSNYLMLTSFNNKWNKMKNSFRQLFENNLIDEQDLSKEEKLRNDRIEIYKKMIADLDDSTETEYDKYKWLKQAVNEDVSFIIDIKDNDDIIKDRLTFKENYEKTHWYRFQEAVKKYQSIAENKLKAVLDQIEVKNW